MPCNLCSICQFEFFHCNFQEYAHRAGEYALEQGSSKMVYGHKAGYDSHMHAIFGRTLRLNVFQKLGLESCNTNMCTFKSMLVYGLCLCGHCQRLMTKYKDLQPRLVRTGINNEVCTTEWQMCCSATCYRDCVNGANSKYSCTRWQMAF